MHEKVFESYQKRIAHFLGYVGKDIYPDSEAVSAVFARTKEPVPFLEKDKLAYLPIKEGDVWGHEWENAWFQLRVTVPERFDGKELCLRAHLGGESLIFDEEGTPLYGLSGTCVFQEYFCKDRYGLGIQKGGTELIFYLEGAANALSGVVLDQPHEIKKLCPDGRFTASIKHLQLSVFDRTLWNMITDFIVLTSMLEFFGQKDYRGHKLLYILNEALDLYADKPVNAALVRNFFAEKAFKNHAASSILSVCAQGHAHIDVGWLWPVRESIRKAARTFSSQIRMLELYPDYIFGASQAELYRMVKENYPGLYEKIRTKIKEGRWEVQGGMWVEPDCNLISGESMVRQFLHGKNFFRDEFGIEVKNLWLPDVFGYSATMPQIIKKARCDFFLTQKISWNQVNKFPYNSFRWKGIDGTMVITHFPPENNYSSISSPAKRMKAQNEFQENGFLDEFMGLFGIGDGGGGPMEEHLERELRMKDLDGCPKSRFGRADEFFNRLALREKELPLWTGELYLELHRGTLTTQARTKRDNRMCEQALTALEIFSSMLPAEKYPSTMLDKAWKTLLVNQFHDILPGSSIHMIYEQTEKEYAEILHNAAIEMKKTSAELFKQKENSCVLVNTLSYEWEGVMEFPESWMGCEVLGEEGICCPAQIQDGKYLVWIHLPANSFTVFRKGKILDRRTEKLSFPVLENALIRYEFSPAGELLSAFDKEMQMELLSAPGNILTLYRDEPAKYEAWEIEPYYKRDREMVCKGTLVNSIQGLASSSLFFQYNVNDSIFQQEVRLGRSKRLDFITHVQWHESRKFLRTAFPLAIESESASFDIPYGFIKRSTGENTSWDGAKFEVCGQRYADLSRQDYGVALLNDCKYGYSVKNSLLELSLLRAPVYPDCMADQGEHFFTYSFFPHIGSLDRTVQQESAILNRSPYIAENFTVKENFFCRIQSDSVNMEVIKKAEKSNDIILRLVETLGRSSKVLLSFEKDVASALYETDLLEWEDLSSLPLMENQAQITLKPFEIKTLRVKKYEKKKNAR